MQIHTHVHLEALHLSSEHEGFSAGPAAARFEDNVQLLKKNIFHQDKFRTNSNRAACMDTRTLESIILCYQAPEGLVSQYKPVSIG